MPKITSPAPPWRIRLKGVKTDLEDLAQCLHGNTRVLQHGNFHFLESEHLNTSSTLDEVLVEAKSLLRVISSVARLRRSVALPVEVAAIYCKDSRGEWLQRSSYAFETVTIYPNIVHLTPETFERCLELALSAKLVRVNLEDFLGQWDFPRLRRVAELILLDLGDNSVKRGLRELAKRQWATQEGCKEFWDTVNHGDGDLLGAHSHLRRAPGENPMNLIQAGEFLRDILAQWVESKI